MQGIRTFTWNGRVHNMLNKQVRKASALKHSMFQSDCLLFQTTLSEWSELSQEAKWLWLKLVKIAVHEINVIHKCTPDQRVITDFFPEKSNTPSQQYRT
eukprot:8325222-Ditylum_brightwellii.AAC.1